MRLGAAFRAWRAHARYGLPDAPPRQEQVGLGVAAAAAVWMLLVALWGVNAPFGDGHFAATASIGVAAQNIWRHGIPYPLLTYVDTFPIGANYYMHHPLGLYWVMALLVKVFGAHNWVLRLPAVAYSTLSAVFLYRLGRAVWGPLPGATSSLAFVSLPITLGFANFHAFEGPVICGLVIASWGYARFTQTWRTSYALASVAGFCWAANHDFVAYMWAAPFLAWLFLRIFFLPPRWFGELAVRAAARYWALMVAGALAAAALLLALMIQSGKLAEMMRMYGVRSSGNATPLATVLRQRHVWITMMFPGLAIALGKLALPVVLGRFAVRRDDRELLPLWILIAAAIQYVHFKQGADVHIFWPQYFAAYLAMGVGALTATLEAGLAWLAPRLRGRWQALAAGQGGASWLAAGLVALPLLFVLRDGASTLRLAHESSGRFVSTHIKSDIDRVVAMRWWVSRIGPRERIAFHAGIQPVHWGLQWELRQRTLQHSQPLGGPGSDPRYFAMDSRFASADELRQAVTRFHVEAVGWFWFMDRAAPPAPLDGYSFAEREPGMLEGFFTDDTEPHRTVRADPWVTWEWRKLLGQAASVPTGTPTSRDQLRIQHNVAVVAGETAAAARSRAELARTFNIHPTARFDDGMELLGGFHSHGAERAVTLYFLAGPGGVKGRHKFNVSAKVVRAPLLSTLPKDPETIEIAEPPGIPTDLWKPGQIYSVSFSYRKRPGTERLFGSFVSLDGARAPVVVDGRAAIDILRL